MSPAQYTRVRQIARSIDMGRYHPSPSVREAYAAVSEEAVTLAVEKIEDVLKRDDGRMAFVIINTWHKHGEISVIKLVSGLFPVPPKPHSHGVPF